MSPPKPCPLCQDSGQCPRPGNWREDGYWEDCPMCTPPAVVKVPEFVGWVALALLLALLFACQLVFGG